MRNWLYLITLLIATTIVLTMISTLYGCATFEIIKEGAKATKIITTADTIDKKLKENEKTNEEKERENTIACIKVQPECEL